MVFVLWSTSGFGSMVVNGAGSAGIAQEQPAGAVVAVDLDITFGDAFVGEDDHGCDFGCGDDVAMSLWEGDLLCGLHLVLDVFVH